MNEKHELQKIIESCENVRATLRWLHKANPNLWVTVVELTEFLPLSASAPQRVWHILNDVYEIPRCPISDKTLKWDFFDVGYKKYGDLKSRNEGVAKAVRDTMTKEGHWRDKDPEKAKKANKKYSDGYSSGQHKPREMTLETIKNRTESVRQACLEKYGVDNYWKSEEFKKQQQIHFEERYKESREARTEREKYYDEVGHYTEKSWVENFYLINPGRLIERSPENHLDHIYSRAEGFRNGVSPEVIGHWTNLRLISRIENSSKRDRCDKTYEQLMEDFENNTRTIIG